MPLKKILFVGGGTGGHILPLKNLITISLEKGANISFILADQSLDRDIFDKNFKDMAINPYFIKTGKIRRYFSWENFRDFFRIFGAFFAARKIIKTEKPDILFFKGGFVCFPVLIAAKFLFSGFKGKIYLHESDSTTSNLGKFISKFTNQTFTNFGETPIRLFYSPKSHQKQKKGTMPQLLIFGGSQGAQFINETFHANANEICNEYKVILISGPGKSIKFENKNFEQSELLPVEEMAEKITQADLIISRGSASIFQILENKKPSIIIPLPSAARNHQYINTLYFEEKGLVKMLIQDDKSAEKLIPLIEETLKDKKLLKNLEQIDIKNNAHEIADIILEN